VKKTKKKKIHPVHFFLSLKIRITCAVSSSKNTPKYFSCWNLPPSSPTTLNKIISEWTIYQGTIGRGSFSTYGFPLSTIDGRGQREKYTCTSKCTYTLLFWLYRVTVGNITFLDSLRLNAIFKGGNEKAREGSPYLLHHKALHQCEIWLLLGLHLILSLFKTKLWVSSPQQPFAKRKTHR